MSLMTVTALSEPNLFARHARRLGWMVVTICFALAALCSGAAFASEPQSTSVLETECPVASVEPAVHARRTAPAMQSYMCRMPEQPWDPGLAKQGKKVDETSESEVKRVLIGCSPRHGARNADDEPHLSSRVRPRNRVAQGLSLLNGVPAGRAPPVCRAH
jgi:hypothetical protein